VEQGTDELGFTRVAVSDHSQISYVLRGKCFHDGKISFSDGFQISNFKFRTSETDMKSGNLESVMIRLLVRLNLYYGLKKGKKRLRTKKSLPDFVFLVYYVLN
jgi:hypothetical protein